MFRGANNYWIVNTCSVGRVCISIRKCIWRTFISICSNIFIKWTLHIEYVTAVLESVVQFDCFIREYHSIFGHFVRGVRYIIIAIICFVSCSLFTVCFLSLHHNKFKGGKKRFRRAKPLFATPPKCLCLCNCYVLASYPWIGLIVLLLFLLLRLCAAWQQVSCFSYFWLAYVVLVYKKHIM